MSYSFRLAFSASLAASYDPALRDMAVWALLGKPAVAPDWLEWFVKPTECCRALHACRLQERIPSVCWLALIEAAGHVCYRYRLAAFRSHLVAQGIEIEPRPLARGSWAQWRQFADLGNYDGVIVQRRLLSWVSLARLRREARAVLFDFDDAVYQRDSYARKGPRSVRRLFRFWATLYFADGVIAGNHYLAGRAADWVGPEKVTRMPTCVEPLEYPSAHHRAR